MLVARSVTAIAILCASAGIAASNRDQLGPLASEVEYLPSIIAAIEKGDFGATLEQKAKAIKGAVNFFTPYPEGNGRACA
ncbi:MAG TPA: hypothetical protein VNA21_00800, partial [Steroidobacteraceae bacterium]|nr:hypothetical protein [Steroidobacteraceae bacterium]